jgi:hypothetical protein
MTVGELVKQAWDKKVVDEDMIRLRFDIVPSMNAIDILHTLGIWGAEVLEYDREAPDIYQGWPEHRKADGSLDNIHFPSGCHVIVLPCKEEE